jgi:hypothetical protein
MLTLPLRAAPPRRCANSDMMSVLCGDPGITLSRRIVAPHASREPAHGAITIAAMPYFLSFDVPAEQAPRRLCVSPIESDGSGLPPLNPLLARRSRLLERNGHAASHGYDRAAMAGARQSVTLQGVLRGQGHEAKDRRRRRRGEWVGVPSTGRVHCAICYCERSEMLTLPLRAAPPRRCANSDMMSVLCITIAILAA